MTTSSPELTTPKAGPPARVEHKLHAKAMQAMSSRAEPAEADSPSSEPAALRRDIEEVRGERANTVDALEAKADVKSRVQEFKKQATHKVQAVRAQAMAKAPRLSETAQQQAQQVIQRKSGAVAGAALIALVLLALRRRRRDKDKKNPQSRGWSRTSQDRRGTRVLAVLGSLMGCRGRENNS
jgi:MYXO-CTERM domain-containing protein